MFFTGPLLLINYRGITLLSIPGKVYVRVILSRIMGHLQQLRRKEQSGFTPHRSTTDLIATLRMILQTRREFRRPTWVAYVDFRAAFDSVNRQSLWRYEHPPIASLLTGVAQQADLVSPGFEQWTATSNHSTLDFTVHYDEHRIVLPGDGSWKRLCSSSVPPYDDDDIICYPALGPQGCY